MEDCKGLENGFGWRPGMESGDPCWLYYVEMPIVCPRGDIVEAVDT